MDWLLYFVLTGIFYTFRLTRLKSRTEQERIGSTPVFFSTVGFFCIFEFVFADSLFKMTWFHLLGLLFSMLYALSIYVYLRSLKQDIEGIFYKLVKQSQGKISVLTFMQRTNLSKDEAMDYLDNKLLEYPGTMYETLGNIYYDFQRW